MKIAGIIAEYNPMHSGHMYQLQNIRADAKVVLMSGHFTQRGEPAVWDKWVRAEIAVRHGADLVLELPVDFAVASAERFASGGISVLNRLGLITHLVFGAESPLPVLQNAARALQGNLFEQAMRQSTAKKLPYHIARNALVQDAAILKGSNNILGIEYLKALQKQNAEIEPVVILRKGAAYRDLQPQDDFASARCIRQALRENADCSAYLPYPLPQAHTVFAEDMFPYLRYRILQGNLEGVAEMREGIQNRMFACAQTAESYNDLITQIKSKRYTHTAICRMLTLAFLNIQKNDLSDVPQYTRVLAANRVGCSLLKKMRTCAKLPIITKGADAPNCTEAALDFRAGQLYHMLAKAPPQTDFIKSPYIQK